MWNKVAICVISLIITGVPVGAWYLRGNPEVNKNKAPDTTSSQTDTTQETGGGSGAM